MNVLSQAIALKECSHSFSSTLPQVGSLIHQQQTEAETKAEGGFLERRIDRRRNKYETVDDGKFIVLPHSTKKRKKSKKSKQSKQAPSFNESLRLWLGFDPTLEAFLVTCTQPNKGYKHQPQPRRQRDALLAPLVHALIALDQACGQSELCCTTTTTTSSPNICQVRRLSRASPVATNKFS